MDKNSLHNLPVESAEELYENAPCGYISFLSDGTIFRLNTTLLHLLGYGRKEEIIKIKKIQDLFRIGGKIYFETHFFPLVKMQGFVKEINFDLVKKDGSFFPALLNVNQIKAPSSGLVTYRGSLVDITDRKNYEKVLLEGKKKAEEATRAKAEFLSTISHEVRTPLNAIVGIGNLIQKTSLDELQREYARILQLSSANLLELVNNLLDLSKLESQKVKLEKRNFSLKQLLEVLFQSFELRAKEKKIKLIKEYSGNLPDHLLGDPIKINQILTNLLGNALKFTKEGHVKIKIEEIQRSEKKVTLRFTVCDTGIGIPKDKLEIIFREFSQASYDVNLEYGGTGLGLTISQKLLQMHGSELKVESEEGKGSEFSFSLSFELSEETAPSRESRSRLTEILAASGARVLVVDDNPVNLFITSQYLQEWGLNHETVGSGEAAKNAVNDKVFDVILMDLHMPKMNGYETSAAIREMFPEPPPVIIALSASGRGDVNLKMKRAGINAYVPKPFHPPELQEVMVHFLTGNTGDPGNNKDISFTVNEQPMFKGKGKAEDSEPVNLERYHQLAKGDKAILTRLIKNSLKSIKKLREEFSLTVYNEKGEKLRRLIHKHTMTLHYLQAYRLSQLLEEYRENLQEEIEKQVQEDEKANIMEELDKIITRLTKTDPSQLL